MDESTSRGANPLVDPMVDWIEDRVPSLEDPISQACTQSQTDSAVFAYWCRRLQESPFHHRKQWEWCYIMQALAVHGMLAPGRVGLGFGVGTEPLADLMVSYGCRIVATDLDVSRAAAAGWVSTHQHANAKSSLRQREISPPDLFESNLDFRVVDMKSIPMDLRNFDFTWSACALEHLGSIESGIRFIEESLETLRPGGVAIHTTELNCSSDLETLEDPECVLFRRSDLAALGSSLRSQGHEIRMSFTHGDLPDDEFVDAPPCTHNPHLKLRVGRYTTTSYGLIIRRREP